VKKDELDPNNLRIMEWRLTLSFVSTNDTVEIWVDGTPRNGRFNAQLINHTFPGGQTCPQLPGPILDGVTFFDAVMNVIQDHFITHHPDKPPPKLKVVKK